MRRVYHLRSQYRSGSRDGRPIDGADGSRAADRPARHGVRRSLHAGVWRRGGGSLEPATGVVDGPRGQHAPPSAEYRRLRHGCARVAHGTHRAVRGLSAVSRRAAGWCRPARLSPVLPAGGPGPGGVGYVRGGLESPHRVPLPHSGHGGRLDRHLVRPGARRAGPDPAGARGAPHPGVRRCWRRRWAGRAAHEGSSHPLATPARRRSMKERLANGPAAAAILAAGIGCFALGLATTVEHTVVAGQQALTLYPAVGSHSGTTAVAVLVWVATWCGLHSRWRTLEVDFSRVFLGAL